MTSMPTINIDDAQAACLRLNACIIDFVCLEVSKSNRFRQTPQLSTMARRCAPMVAKKLASFLMQDSTAGIAVMEEAINQSLLHMKQDGWLGTFGASLKSKHQAKTEIMGKFKVELEKNRYKAHMNNLIKMYDMDAAQYLIEQTERQEQEKKERDLITITEETLSSLMEGAIVQSISLAQEQINMIQQAFFPSPHQDHDVLVIEQGADNDDLDQHKALQAAVDTPSISQKRQQRSRFDPAKQYGKNFKI